MTLEHKGDKGDQGIRGERGVKGDKGDNSLINRTEFDALCLRFDGQVKVNADTNTRLSRIEGGISALKWVLGIGLSTISVAIAALGIIIAIQGK